MDRRLRKTLVLAASTLGLLAVGGYGQVGSVSVPAAYAANEHANEHAATAGENGNGGNSAAALANAGPNDNQGGGPSGNPGNKNGVNSPGLDAKAGAVHAVNANLQAFLHANPKSEVGLLATYAKAEVNVEKAGAAIIPLATAFNGTLTTFKSTYPGLDYSIQGLEALHDELAALPAPTAAQLAELASLNTILASPQAQALIDAQTALAVAEATATADLANAANKPVDADVQAYVDAQLEDGGILDYYRAH